MVPPANGIGMVCLIAEREINWTPAAPPPPRQPSDSFRNWRGTCFSASRGLLRVISTSNAFRPVRNGRFQGRGVSQGHALGVAGGHMLRLPNFSQKCRPAERQLSSPSRFPFPVAFLGGFESPSTKRDFGQMKCGLGSNAFHSVPSAAEVQRMSAWRNSCPCDSERIAIARPG
jgi:hypothetical protein